MKNLKMYLLLCLCLSAFQSCKPKNEVTIRGNITGLKNEWVYLTYNYPIESLPFDSVKADNGNFEFKFRPDTILQPQLIRLSYSTNTHNRANIGVINPYERNKDGFARYAAFIMEPGVTVANGDLSKDKDLIIDAGPQNEFYFKHLDLPFQRISKDPVKRKAQLMQIEGFLDDYPDAYWTLFAFQNLRFNLTHAESTHLYGKFSDNIKQSYQGKHLLTFINNQPARADKFINNIFVDIKRQPQPLIDTTKKLNIVVFWASWCGPCRQEIPSLKKIAAIISSPQIRMVSVSIDIDRAAWLKSVKEQNMPWQQLSMQPEKQTIARAQYNLGFIPQIYLVNNKLQVVKKIDGFREENELAIGNFINQYITSK